MEPAGEPYSAFLLGDLRLEQGTFEGLVEVFDRLVTFIPDLPLDTPLPLILAGVGLPSGFVMTDRRRSLT